MRWIIALLSLLPFGCSSTPASRAPLPVWAFCGVDPDDPHADEALAVFASAGIDAMMGQCNRPPADYTPVDPGSRYSPPDVYHRLVEKAAMYGIRVVVFDDRIWSDDADVRAAAIAEWEPWRAWIAAWDMGDEWGPNQWPILEHRWQLVLDGAAKLGPQPYTNNVPWMLDAAYALDPTVLSYDDYDVGSSVDTAGAWSPLHPNLMCSVNALVHGPYTPTAASLKSAMKRHRAVGCDMILLFGGMTPIDTDGFTTPSLVNPDGTATRLAAAVKAGAA